MAVNCPVIVSISAHSTGVQSDGARSSITSAIADVRSSRCVAGPCSVSYRDSRTVRNCSVVKGLEYTREYAEAWDVPGMVDGGGGRRSYVGRSISADVGEWSDKWFVSCITVVLGCVMVCCRGRSVFCWII